MTTRAFNPYVAGTPLRGESGFFGRRDTIEWVIRELHNPATNALVLFGQRRIGKTSLLLQLQRELPSSEFLPVYFDLQDQTQRALGTVLADLADTLGEHIGMHISSPRDFDNQGHFFEREFLPQAYKTLGDSHRLVFLFDEFDVMDQVAEAELPDTAAAKALLPFLRRLMTADLRPAFVFVVGRRAEDLSVDFMATFKSSLKREIWILQPENAEALVRQAEVNGSLRFTHSGVTRIQGLTNDHPYLTQLLCQRIWERVYATNPVTPPVIDIQEVETATADALEAGDQALAWLWNGLSPAEKIYAAALAEVAEEGQTIPEDRIIQVLTTHAARLRTREVELAPRDLVRRRVLEVAGEREYRFAIELFRRWVRLNKPVRDVKDELDRIEPVADRLYAIGRDYFNRRQWDNAVRFFRDALAAYPRHFRARLYLGETWMEQSQVDEAVSELQQAYELDRDEARLPLARALVVQAEMREKSADEDGALMAAEKALEVSPKEQAAQAVLAGIWMRRGDAALERNELEEALSAFQKAGDAHKIAHIKSLQKGQEFTSLVSEAEAYEKTERWSEAAAAYEQLIPQAPNEESREAWQTALEHCRVEEELASLFLKGVGALGQMDWKQARHVFAEVIRRRPDYRKNGLLAASLLEQAVMERKRILSKRSPLFIAVLAVVIVTGLAIVAIQARATLESSQTELTQSYSELTQSYSALTQSYSELTPSYSGLAQTYFERGNANREQGDVASAIALYDRAIELEPNRAEYYIWRGVAHRDSGDLELALSDHNRAIELEPENPSHYFERAWTYREAYYLQNFSESLPNSQAVLESAIADFSQSITLSPDDPNLYNQRASMYREFGDFEAALADHNRAIELNPDDPNLYVNRAATSRVMGNFEESLADHGRAIELASDIPSYYFERAWTYRDAYYLQSFSESLPNSQAVLEAAIADFSQSITLSPDDPNPYNERASTYRELGNFEAALADHNRAIELNPDDPNLSLNRAFTYREMGDLEEALADHNRAIELNPEDPNLYVNRAVTYRGLGDLEAALADHNRAIELAPDNPGYYLERAWTYRDAHRIQLFSESLPDSQTVLEFAIADFNRAIELEPDDPGYYYFERGAMYLDKGDQESAIADFNQGIDLRSDDPYWFFLRSVTYQEMGNPDAAIASLDQAVEFNPDHPYSYYFRGEFYNHWLEQPDQAVREYEKFLELVDRSNCSECEGVEQYINEQQIP